MKQFLKFMFASFAGTVLTLILILLLFAGMVASISSMAQKQSIKTKPHTVLHIAWKATIRDRTPQNPFENFDFNTMKPNRSLGLNDILKDIGKAAKDPNVDGIFLDMGSVPAGIATTEEIYNKLKDFKKSGKFIVSYANNYDQKAYYLASLSNKIYLNPEGVVLFKGLSAQVMFLKNLLDKLDIKAQVIRGPDNKYKSAVEPLLLDKMSAANRQQTKALLQSIWGNMLAALSENRHVSVAEMNKLADNLTLSDAEQALKHHFIDGIAYRDMVLDSIKKRVGTKPDYMEFAQYDNVQPEKKKERISRNSIAVIYALGDISKGKSRNNNIIGSATLAEAIREARTNKHVKAIVMRVNSPGGDAQASDIIRREVALAKKAKPFIVSMGNVAASGGYWISTDASYIFAQPTTITGSIGVFGIIPDFQGFMNKKLGITFDKVMTNKNADFVDIMAPMSPLQKQKLNAGITRIYKNFVTLVARTRHLRKSFVDSIARGHVWAGSEGLKLGLVDSLGGLQDAIAYAAKKAKLGKNYRIINYPKRKEFLQELMEEFSGKVQSRILANKLQVFEPYLSGIQTFSQMKGVQARLPYVMKIE
ncbi:MAG: signal peptide peptidase SppA [bacterium]|nr:MAG: signal peptide peptidase SppA [bacterium]